MQSRTSVRIIQYRYILNSHFQWVMEFVIKLHDGSIGIGSSPQGETLSVYEKQAHRSNKEFILSDLINSKVLKDCDTQERFDHFLISYKDRLDTNSIFALSTAYLNATSSAFGLHQYELLRRINNLKNISNICPIFLCNILNGGFHAYTNPVLSDFHEYLLVPRFQDIYRLVESFTSINREVKVQLHRLPQEMVSGNPVYCSRVRDNRVWLEFLLKVLHKLNLSDDFDFMIDASAGDLYSNKKYNLSITNKKLFTQDQFYKYWEKLINEYPVQIIEDPFGEFDVGNWKWLTAQFPKKLIAGDNLFATDPQKIKDGGRQKLASAVLIKPNQIGTIMEVIEAIKIAQKLKILPITSHRSIETESSILTDLTIAFNVPIMKIGLFSDFETIIKLNKFVRYLDVKKR